MDINKNDSIKKKKTGDNFNILAVAYQQYNRK